MVSEVEAQGTSEMRAKLSISFPAASCSQGRLILSILSTCSVCGVVFVCLFLNIYIFSFLLYKLQVYNIVIHYSH